MNVLFVSHSKTVLNESKNLTVLLREWGEGDRGAENELFALVEPDLRRIARAQLRRETRPSLQSIDLVNEVYLRIAKTRRQDWRDRHHFFALMARMMRRYLIDRARARPKAIFTPVDGLADVLSGDGNDLALLLTIDRLLTELEKVNPEWCTVVELKFFLGLTDKEGSEVLKVPERTFQRRWETANDWLKQRFVDEGAAKKSG